MGKSPNIWVAYVRNPYLDEDICHIGVSEHFADMVTTVITEADNAGHEDVVELAQLLFAKGATGEIAVFGTTVENGDGITYHIVPVHNNDAH